jgi:hypothetical protein
VILHQHPPKLIFRKKSFRLLKTKKVMSVAQIRAELKRLNKEEELLDLQRQLLQKQNDVQVKKDQLAQLKARQDVEREVEEAKHLRELEAIRARAKPISSMREAVIARSERKKHEREEKEQERLQLEREQQERQERERLEREQQGDENREQYPDHLLITDEESSFVQVGDKKMYKLDFHVNSFPLLGPTEIEEIAKKLLELSSGKAGHLQYQFIRAIFVSDVSDATSTDVVWSQNVSQKNHQFTLDSFIEKLTEHGENKIASASPGIWLLTTIQIKGVGV